MNKTNNLIVMNDVKTWLNLSSRWRLALEVANSKQNKLDDEIVKHLSGTGEKPFQHSIAELASAWDLEYIAKQRMNNFMHSKGYDGVMTMEEIEISCS